MYRETRKRTTPKAHARYFLATESPTVVRLLLYGRGCQVARVHRRRWVCTIPFPSPLSRDSYITITEKQRRCRSAYGAGRLPVDKNRPIQYNSPKLATSANGLSTSQEGTKIDKEYVRGASSQCLESRNSASQYEIFQNETSVWVIEVPDR